MSTAFPRIHGLPAALAVILTLALAGPAAAYDGGTLSTGGSHACQVAGGSVQCWGSNAWGQLGAGSTAFSSVAPLTATSISGATAVSAGFSHTCAIANGAPWCWGRGVFGQLGDGTTTAEARSPVSVIGVPSTQTRVTAGVDHSCSTNGQKVYCWGENGHGQLGTGDNTDSNTGQPVLETVTYSILGLAAGDSFSCEFNRNGATSCWGLNNLGQLGNGTTTSTSTPTPVSGLSSGVTAISAGQGQACAVKDGAAYCWGQNTSGEVVNGSVGSPSESVKTPTQVVGLTSGVTAISAGNGFTCAIQNSTPKCWGENTWGQLGDGTTNNSTTPVVAVEYPFAADVISVGDKIGCASGGFGQKCWGSSEDGGSLLGPNTAQRAASYKLKRNGKPTVKGKYVKFRLKATVAIPPGAPAASACTGKLTLSFKAKGTKKTFKASARPKSKGNSCVASLSLKLPKKYKGKKVKFKATHAGNVVFLPLSKTLSYRVR